LLGGFDFQTMTSRPDWEIVRELRKQYEVVEANPDMAIDPEIDVLVAALPSSLSQAQMDVLADYVTSGRPALLLLDPLPVQFPQLSPSQPKRPPQANPYGPPPPTEEKGDLNGLLERLGLSWQDDAIIWDTYNPLPKLQGIPPEFTFISPEAGGRQPFNPAEIVTTSLSRVLMMFPGALRQVAGSMTDVSQLLTTGPMSGQLRWADTMTTGFMGQMQINAYRRHILTGQEYVLGVRVRNEPPAGPRSEDLPPPVKANAIVLADLDMISDMFFGLRRQGIKDLQFDNVTFLLNCVDDLAGDVSLIELRSRRPRYRTLTTIEKKRQEFQKDMLAREKAAEDEAARQLQQAQRRLDDKVEELKKRTDIDDNTKSIMLAQLERVENKRLESTKAEIEARKKEQTDRAEKEMYRGIRRIENSARVLAVVLPPLPAILIGLLILAYQVSRERASTPLSRAMRTNR